MNQLNVGEWYALPGVDDVLIGLITRKEFLDYPEWITQRNTRNRIKKKGVIDHLRKLFPTHHIVALGELLEPDIWEDGEEYDTGDTWRLDANSRGLVWEEGLSDRVPENVLAVKYRGKTLKDLRSIYWAFDNPTAAEIASEVVTGCMKSLKFTAKTKKFQEGQFVTALSYTCMFDNPEEYGSRGLWTESNDDSITQSEYKRMKTLQAVYEYLPTITAVDNLLSITGVNSCYDQTFLTSLFLYHIKSEADFSKNVIKLCKLLAETKDDDGEVEPVAIAKKGKLTPAGWIVRENVKFYSKPTDIQIPNRGKIDGFYEGVPFFTYWISIADKHGNKDHKQNVGARQGYKRWFNDTFLKRADVSSLEKAFNMTPLTTS